MLSDLDVTVLYKKYHSELRRLARLLRPQFHEMNRKGFATEFSDVEGEVAYLLVRELKPDIVFEISPAAGWSTNYLLAALTANQNGVLHSFETKAKTRGISTAQAISENQVSGNDLDRLVIHVGDAREKVKEVQGEIQFLLLDSEHEEAFAQWYVSSLFPRVKGCVLIHDIAFEDGLEISSESRFMWSWLRERKADFSLVSAFEKTLERQRVRAGLAERHHMRSNAVVFRLPPHVALTTIELGPSPEKLIEKAEQLIKDGDIHQADELLSDVIGRLIGDRGRLLRERLLVRIAGCFSCMGEKGEAERCFQRALGIALQEDPGERCKALVELWEHVTYRKEWRIFWTIVGLVLFTPETWPLLWNRLGRYLRDHLTMLRTSVEKRNGAAGSEIKNDVGLKLTNQSEGD